MKLLVGSVFTDHPRSKDWFKLQCHYLQNTVTTDYEHVIFLNGKDEEIFAGYLIGKSTERKLEKQEHLDGLNHLLKYFRKQDCEYFLILDSDCFPFFYGWHDKLIKAMGNFQVAASVRYENLDNFAHPSIFFFSRNVLKDLRFTIGVKNNLLDIKSEDVISNVDKFFPLIRTNKLNYHPISFGIYWNMFYHHGAGSRRSIFRSFNFGYHQNDSLHNIESALYKRVVTCTDSFLEEISGRKPIKSSFSIGLL